MKPLPFDVGGRCSPRGSFPARNILRRGRPGRSPRILQQPRLVKPPGCFYSSHFLEAKSVEASLKERCDRHRVCHAANLGAHPSQRSVWPPRLLYRPAPRCPGSGTCSRWRVGRTQCGDVDSLSLHHTKIMHLQSQQSEAAVPSRGNSTLQQSGVAESPPQFAFQAGDWVQVLRRARVLVRFARRCPGSASRCAFPAVGVRELVDKRELRRAPDHGVDVHLLELEPAVLRPQARHGLEPLRERRVSGRSCGSR